MKITFTPPNQLTFLRIILTPVFVAFLLSSTLIFRQLSVLVFFVAMLTDWYDGWVARRWGYITRWGAFLDPLADKIFASAALFAFLALQLLPAWTVWIIVGRDIAITILRSYSEYKGKPFDTTKFAKTKTFLQFVVLCYVLLLFIARDTPYFQNHRSLIDSLLSPSLLYSSMVAITAITVWTGVVYVIDNWKTIRELYAISNRAPESN